MKKLIQKLLLLSMVFSILFPLQVFATGEGNIDNGGSDFGSGTNTNYWSSHDEGVRVTVVRTSDGAAASSSVDLTNKSPNNIRVHFGKVSKSSYRNGSSLALSTGAYQYINPSMSLPQIISTSSGGANLAAIKSYFTDEQVIRGIAGYVGMNFDTLVSGDYKLLLEPIAYVHIRVCAQRLPQQKPLNITSW